MRPGKVSKINWHKFECAKGKFRMPKKRWSVECGAFALHALTKVPVEDILPLSDRGHWSNATMFKFLRDRGFEIIPVTLGNVVDAYSVKDPFDKYKLSTRHVILVEQLCYKEENTWAVIHNGKIAHSGGVKKLGPMEFVNWPIYAAYVIFHKDWKTSDFMQTYYVDED